MAPRGAPTKYDKLAVRYEATILIAAVNEWLRPSAVTRPAGASRIRAKMAHAVELVTVLGSDRVDQALGLAATAGRFGEDDLVSILEHIAASKPAGQVVRADEAHSVQNGTIAWQALGQQPTAEGESRTD